MQVLQITTTPAKYELDVEHARLEHNSNFQPRANVTTTQGELKIQTKPASLRLDTYQARKSLGFASVADRIQAAAQQGKDALSQYMRGTVIEGQQMSNIHQGTTIKSIANQNALKPTELQMTFLPTTGAQISSEPGQISMDYQMGTTNYDWQIQSNSMSYVPGSVRLRLVQRAEVDIQYTGAPLYFPRSANPDYEETAVG